MPVLVRIAFRNLLEHKSKSLIIGVLLALGVVILIVGNAFMDTAARGVKSTFIANYTGDVFVAARTKGSVSLFGAQSMDDSAETRSLPDFDRIVARLEESPGVEAAAGQVTSFALASLKDAPDPLPGEDEEDGMPGFALLFGIDPTSYYRLFDQATPVMGRLLEPGEEGLVITKATLERFKKSFKAEPRIGDQVLLTGMMGKAGFKIRSVPLVGVVSFRIESEANDFISYADVNTVRILAGLTVGDAEEAPVSAEQRDLLAASGDDLFGGGETLVLAASAAPTAPRPAAAASPAASRPAQSADAGAWHFAMARLTDPDAAPAVIASLNLWFAQEGIDAFAADWKAAAGPFAQSIDVIRIIFNVAIIIVAVVAVIIMTNTLVISVIERTGEIGTMRALGAPKGFVRRMFLIETLVIAGVFGLVGTVFAFVAVWVIDLIRIQATNPFLKILFAGDVLHPVIGLPSVLMSLVLVGVVAVLAHLYPVSLALKIEPVRAMQVE